MKGDFTRDTFDQLKHFSRVLMQQGRVTLDADHNEQIAILLRYTRKLARDLIGPYAAPAGGGFQLQADPRGVFTIGKGCYYVDGILVENDTDNCTYKNQPDYRVPADDELLAAVSKPAAQTFFVYLDVWERHITALEDDSIREKALGGPDTGTRARVVWQVKAILVPEQFKNKVPEVAKRLQGRIDALLAQLAALQKKSDAQTDPLLRAKIFVQMLTLGEQIERETATVLLTINEIFLRLLSPLSKASLAARVDPGLKIEDACVTPPESKYRGLENHLYRVEIHREGAAGAATFKWSRDNGSVATAWLDTSGHDLLVASTRGFAAGNWVELSDDNSDLLFQPGTLVKLAKVEGGTLTVDPSAKLPARGDYPLNPKVRRWDQIDTAAVTLDDGAMPVRESADQNTGWIDLEDGVQIQFAPGGDYRTGDYWLIPARFATGKIEWPMDALNPQQSKLLPPHGVQHHFAALGSISWPKNELQIEEDRFEFSPQLSYVTASTANMVHIHIRDVVTPLVKPAAASAPAATPKTVTKPKRRSGPRAPA